MDVHKKWKSQPIFAGMLAVLAIGSVIFQYVIATGTTINFLSFFTIQCNLLVGICMTFAAFFPASAGGRFFTSLSVQTAIALYIFIVALVYNTVLRGLYPMDAWNILADTMLHVVIPILYLCYWLFMRPEGDLEYRNGISWLVFPTVYLIYSMIRGSIVHWYPYPFLNAEKSGYGKVSINILVMIAVFLLAGLILIAVTRSLKKKGTA
ncbi:MAG: hypothetical protein EOO13_04285 [Chitinophagaceae bacterium]|nr:MAG: hypothetical protein EOO13_04285 [Chitinophagaceae bacterium]